MTTYNCRPVEKIQLPTMSSNNSLTVNRGFVTKWTMIENYFQYFLGKKYYVIMNIVSQDKHFL